MRVLGIDPGTVVLGYGVVEEKAGSRILKLVTTGVITTSAELTFPERLHHISREVTQLIKEQRPDSMAVEEPFLAKNAKMALQMGKVLGVVIVAGVNAGLEITGYSPLEMKQAIVGYGRAEKKQVQEMVKVILHLNEIPRLDDAADALGIAICHLHTVQSSRGT
ncbi:crossover junction endodeoxyribonuclease RuvC [candidate division NPL-UPA2 bacterium Unc8]|uniref:Crossover junction endodeoxyribonuclease RuvC n=1 Tax=candidate division NPL-UPA2 bacterium Unc8 TaxID=1980939 RepID=A0A399FU55_UNCN2|nr:MAG: crossover junction endodeoxyribonuclease RuvC [candidate division NPL-UPA2 bacterium Unc8]